MLLSRMIECESIFIIDILNHTHTHTKWRRMRWVFSLVSLTARLQATRRQMKRNSESQSGTRFGHNKSKAIKSWTLAARALYERIMRKENNRIADTGTKRPTGLRGGENVKSKCELTSVETVSAGAEWRARYSLCQHKQSSIKSLSWTKLLIDFGLSSPPWAASRFDGVCCKREPTRQRQTERQIYSIHCIHSVDAEGKGIIFRRLAAGGRDGMRAKRDCFPADRGNYVAELMQLNFNPRTNVFLMNI